MAKPEWGRKVTCSSCGAKFYDMRRNPAECPKCGAVNDATAAQKPKRSSAPKPSKAVEEKPKEAETDSDDGDEDLDDLPDDLDIDIDDEDDDEDEDGIMEDTTDLGVDDDDDVSEVKEHYEPEDKD